MPDFKTLNRRLGPVEFISSSADISFFDALVSEVRAMERPGDSITLPRYTYPRAWARVYDAYIRLKQRNALPVDPSIAASERAFANLQANWDRYLNCRNQMASLLQRDAVDDQTLIFLGVRPGDLDRPVGKDGARKEDWLGAFGRIEEALTQLESMSTVQRAAIPYAVAARRAEAKAAALAARVARLEGETRVD